jgi:hypothetical protein
VAKSRPKSRKAARKPGRSKTARKTTRRTVAAARGAVQPPRRSLPLQQLRKDLDLAVAALSRRVEMAGQPAAKVSQAVTVFTRWAAEIDELCEGSDFCGPTMDPLN